MEFSFTIIIPARYASSRLPGKPLLDIKGKPLIQHVFENAANSRANGVYIATDDKRIAGFAESIGAPVVMTAGDHPSGTDRVAEAAAKLGLGDDEIIINLQGDEFALPVSLLNQVATVLSTHPHKKMATLCETIDTMDEYRDPNIVKVIFDKNNSAIYFSRAPVPANHRRDGLPKNVYRHIGLYAYRKSYLQAFTELAPGELEQAEALEQLRVLYYGGDIHVEPAVDKTGIGIDTAEDLEAARSV